MAKRLDFVEGPAWEVGPLEDFAVFFSNLDIILPEDAVLFLEGTSMARDVKEFLASCALSEPENLEVGEGYLGDRLPKERTFKVPFGGELKIFPRGSRFHIAASAIVGYGLAKGRGWQYYLIAAGLHTIINYVVILYRRDIFTFNQSEIYVAAIALLVTLFALWPRWLEKDKATDEIDI